jgi:hypothetical protein
MLGRTIVFGGLPPPKTVTPSLYRADLQAARRRCTILPDERYTDIPRDQLQDAISVTRFVSRDWGIDLPASGLTFRTLLTDINWPTGVAISAADLPDLAALSPEDRSWSPSAPWLETLLEEYEYVIIVPSWLVDLRGALRGDRGAAARWVERIGRRLPDLNRFTKIAREIGVPAPKARLDLITNILLQVVSRRDELLPVWSSSDPAPLQHPDGTLETVVPSQFNPWTFRQWAETQTIRGTKNILEGELLRLDILIDGIEKEGEPSSLWWYHPLDPLSRGGAPSGLRYFQGDDDVVLEVARAIEYQRKRNPRIRITRDETAEIVFRQLGRIGRQGRGGEHSNPGSVLIREAKEVGIKDWADLRSRAEARIKQQRL